MGIGTESRDGSQGEGSQNSSSSTEYPEYSPHPWVFWSGSENNSSSADPANPIHDKIIYALGNIRRDPGIMCQFWAPVTIGGRHLLSTSGQPCAIDLYKDLVNYRINSKKYQYNIDADKIDNGRDPDIMSGGPATAYVNRFPYIDDLKRIPERGFCEETKMGLSIMLPICSPSKSDCAGVLEYIFDKDKGIAATDFVLEMIKEIKKAGLDVFTVQDSIPYKAIDDLKLPKDQIEEALKVVCESHNLALGQCWIPCEDKRDVLLSSSSEDTQTNQLLAIKLTGYLYAIANDFDDNFEPYFRLCDIIPLGSILGGEYVLKTLQNYESHYISTLCLDNLGNWDDDFIRCSAFAICLRSNGTDDFSYAFEFIWRKQPTNVIFLEAILLTLKRCLPSFKFAFGAELGDELDIISEDNNNSGDDDVGETKTFKIFQGRSSSPMPKALDNGKKPMVMDYKELQLERRGLTTPIELSFEEVEKQFGKSMEKAAEALHVSKSTLNRRWREELSKVYVKKNGKESKEWPGSRLKKRKVNESSIINETDTNEEVNGAMQEPSTDDIKMRIEAKYADKEIRFPLSIKATFETLEEKIAMKFKLSVGTYNLNYLDEVGREILLTSTEEMNYCIESSRKSDGRIVVQLSVIPSE